MILYNDICGSLNGWEILFDFFVIGYTVRHVGCPMKVTVNRARNLNEYFRSMKSHSLQTHHRTIFRICGMPSMLVYLPFLLPSSA